MSQLIKITGMQEVLEPSSKQQGKYSVPETLNPDGFYSIQYEKGEMLDLSASKFHSHFVLYDRKEKLALEVTSDIHPNVLFWPGRPPQFMFPDDVRMIEDYLTGKLRPVFDPEEIRGIRSFEVLELADSRHQSMRKRMTDLRDAQVSLDTAIDALRREARDINYLL